MCVCLLDVLFMTAKFETLVDNEIWNTIGLITNKKNRASSYLTIQAQNQVKDNHDSVTCVFARLVFPSCSHWIIVLFTSAVTGHLDSLFPTSDAIG